MNPSYNDNCWVQISGNVSFIFDTTMISTTEDWFASASSCASMYWCTEVLGFNDLYRCDYPLEILSDANVKFYGLIWDTAIVYQTVYGSLDYNPVIGSWSDSTFYCEDCIFSGGGSMEFRSKIVDFNNSVLDNVVLNWFGGDPAHRQSQYGDTVYRGDFILRHDLELNIINSKIINIADTRFVRIASDLQYKTTVNVYNSTITTATTITTFVYVSNSWTYSFVTN
eukprot:457979_1